jgi:hypothetical protein
MRARTIKAVTVPAFGVIKGGRLNTWRFHFLHFRVDGRELEIVARCTPPAWIINSSMTLRARVKRTRGNRRATNG